MRLLILQYAGDYREAVQRFANNGSENYYAQKYTVEGVAQLAAKLEEVSVLCCLSNEPYNEVLSNGVRAIGAGFQGTVEEEPIVKLIEQQKPTHIIMYTPMRKVLLWAAKHQVKVLAMFAESVVIRNWRDRLRAYKLSRILNHKQVEWVGSYGTASSKVLQSIGVNPDKIIPWDFLISSTPGSYLPKTLISLPDPWKLIYVGSLFEAKGVGDILRAVSMLRDRNFPVSLQIVGKDSDGKFSKLTQELNIANIVEFLGIVPTNQIEPLMRKADAVLIPSWHEYPEGFPLTIHHALCSRTPIIASDHPMFLDNLKHRSNSLIFSAANPTALAASIEELFNDSELYASISKEAYSTWHRLRLPVKWGDMLNRWIFLSAENRMWLYKHRLSTELQA